jgi:ABC-type multidrug transport system ATPase subunit
MPRALIPAYSDTGQAGPPAILTERLYKAYGDGARALVGLSLCVGQGEFFGLLGPQGAGKTTMTRISAALLQPDGGRVRVLGFDMRTDARQIRERIGYMGQHAGVDRGLSGHDNVLLMARMHGLRGRDAAQRTEEILRKLDLTALSRQQAGTYTPQEVKRVALASSLVHHPRLVLLDDPTCGLAAHERTLIWGYLRAIQRDEGAAVFLATQCLEEVEWLCDRVAIIDRGKLIAAGTPDELKAQATGALVAVQLIDGRNSGEAALLLEHVAGVRAVRLQHDRIDLEVTSAQTVPSLLRVLEEHEIPVRDITLSRSSLEEVFFHHTGRKIHDSREVPSGGAKVSGRR